MHVILFLFFSSSCVLFCTLPLVLIFFQLRLFSFLIQKLLFLAISGATFVFYCFFCKFFFFCSSVTFIFPYFLHPHFSLPCFAPSDTHIFRSSLHYQISFVLFFLSACIFCLWPLLLAVHKHYVIYFPYIFLEFTLCFFLRHSLSFLSYVVTLLFLPQHRRDTSLP